MAAVTENDALPNPLDDLTPNRDVDLSSPRLNRKRRAMLDLINKLLSTGVQVDIDLPQIAVIGSQSAGKSSLIEAISGITLPRAAGTCTRCPTECRLSRSDTPWQCTVSLRIIIDANGQQMGQAKNVQFGAVIYDKSQVEDRIRRAQLSILNPNVPHSNFLVGSSDDSVTQRQGRLSFSHNAVTLQISGPEVADLSFCDLPGLIASVSSDRGSGDDIGLVKGLVTAYIKKPSCIILLTVACETDFENQGALSLAKEHDPEGRRTIGVLTKPDRIPIGEEANWLPFIRNEKESLENNWFCVKQPSSNDLKSNPTWADARKMENRFFASQAPWNELESIYQKYLRTSNLVERLSSVLSDLISKRLPQIHEELEKSILHTREQLSLLPRAPSSDPTNEVAALLHTFTSDLVRHVAGVSDDTDSFFGTGVGLIQSIHPAQERFRISIRDTAPNFRPFETHDAERKHLPPASFLVAEEGNCPLGDYSEEEEGLSDDGVMLSTSPEKQARNPAIYIDEVLDRAHRARTRELPGIYPFVVQESFINRIIKQWQAPAHILCKTVHSIVLEHVHGLIRKHFSGFGQGHLEQRVRTVMQQHLKACLDRAEDRINWLLELEDLPFSLNTHYLADYKSKFFAYYKGARDKYNNIDLVKAIKEYKTTPPAPKPRMGAPAPESGIAKILSGLAEIGITGVKPEDLANLLPPDRMEPALIIMADVRAYFQVAYKRFADIVPLAIDRELVRGLSQDVLRVLYTNLHVNGPEGSRVCQELAQESPQVADKRLDLQKKLERMNIATEELFSIGV